MPQYMYRGRDKNGALRKGERFSSSADALNLDLIKEGVTPIEIRQYKTYENLWERFISLFQSENAHLEDLAIFARQMQLLHKAGVPMVTALRQISSFTHNSQLSKSLEGCIEHIEKGEKLSSAMQHYPKMFSKLMVN